MEKWSILSKSVEINYRIWDSQGFNGGKEMEECRPEIKRRAVTYKQDMCNGHVARLRGKKTSV